MKSAQERAQIPLQMDRKLLFGRITVTWPRLLASLTVAVSVYQQYRPRSRCR